MSTNDVKEDAEEPSPENENVEDLKDDAAGEQSQILELNSSSIDKAVGGSKEYLGSKNVLGETLNKDSQASSKEILKELSRSHTSKIGSDDYDKAGGGGQNIPSKQVGNQQSHQCPHDAPEEIPCALCYLNKTACHCHGRGSHRTRVRHIQQEDESDGYVHFINLIYTIISVIIFLIAWSIHFWFCVGYALFQGIKRFMQADTKIQIAVSLFVLGMLGAVMIHATIVSYKNSKTHEYSRVPQHVPGHKTVVMPAFEGGNKNIKKVCSQPIKQPLRIEIKRSRTCTLQPREQTFTLQLFNDKMERVYSSSAKIVLPQCGEKPTLNIVPEPFELTQY